MHAHLLIFLSHDLLPTLPEQYKIQTPATVGLQSSLGSHVTSCNTEALFKYPAYLSTLANAMGTFGYYA